MKPFPAFCDLLIKAEKIADKKLLNTILAGIFGVSLKAQEYSCSIFEEFEQCGSIDIFIRLKSHDDENIRILSQGILYFYDHHATDNTCSKRY
uniref:Uncharacterized protein n=1 Tax=Panagrolaimus superbus TaxID=310955 RepID=A0A914Y3V0_9BILA